MEIRKVPISKLNPAAYNPRKSLRPGDAAYEKLSRSLEVFGCVEPVVWNERTGNVVGGHQRLKILLAAGETELEVSVVNLPEAEEKALNIALNKISGEWDEEGLSALLTGFDPSELDAVLNDLAAKTEDAPPFGTEAYVDRFFDSGPQEASKPEPPAAPPAPAETPSEPEPPLEASVTVYGLTPPRLEALTAFLDGNGFRYRREA